ncbi:butyrophilin subfamily 3 member A2-like [Cebidichthys violaceus]|uniref:butyrophilin subfamily 3 member A2-like n=1 Tax=Cebidichthys violaceus TaxID=271503 RepID=UPI0035CB0D6C
MHARVFLVATALLCCAGLHPTSVKGEASPVKIQTFVGETVILPCRIQVSADEDVPSVEWSKEGLKPNITFLYRQGCETFEEKNPVFHYRTNVFMNELKNGNMSLRLSDVRLSDAGTYKCKRISRVPQDTSTIELSVGAASEPKVSVVPDGGVTLQCEASCWFPQPVITFLDAQGDVIGAGDPKDDPSTSGCFYVTRRATVQTGNRFTCRVHQSEINQTRVTEIYIPDDCMGSCTLKISLAVLTSVTLSALIAFLCWKRCNSVGGLKLLSKQSSLQSSTRSNAEREPLRNQEDSLHNADTEHRRIVNDKDEIIRRLTGELEDLRSQQSPVVCRQPMSLDPDRLSHDINPEPAASTNSVGPKSVNFPQNEDSKPGVSIPNPASHIQRSSHNNSSPALLTNSGAASPAFPAEGPHVGHSRSMSDSRPRSNGAKAPRRSTISAPFSNRYTVLANLPEDDAEPLPYMRRE